MLKGIDVSAFQATSPNVEGLNFMFIKTTEGTSYESPKWRKQYAAGKRHGLALGKYHFPNIHANPEREAHYFLRKSDVQEGDILILDWEWSSPVSNSTADRYKQHWLRTVKEAHPQHKILLYCDRNRWLHVDINSYCQDGLWIADWTADPGKPRIEHPWLFHQHSDGAKTATEGDKIDQNVADFASVKSLREWTGQPPAGDARPQS